MGVNEGNGVENLRLHAFTDVDQAPSLAPYFAALEAFDGLPELQELKVLARERAKIGPGSIVLDVGCGFGLESLRLAALVAPGGRVTGIDKSAAFVGEAKRRAQQAQLSAAFQVADAEDLPCHRHVRGGPRRARIGLSARPKACARGDAPSDAPGWIVTAIEPDFGTNAINLSDRVLVRRVLDHECDANIPHGWLVRDLKGMMEDIGFRDVLIETRIVIFTPDLGADYFAGTGKSACDAGVIDAGELDRWTGEIEDLRRRGRLFCSIGYYLFTARM